MARGEALLRQWKLLSALQGSYTGICLDDLADIVGYNRRTVQRDLHLLKEAGFPVEHQPNDAGKRFYRLPRGFIQKQPITLTVDEALSLYLARQLLAPLVGTTLGDGLDSLVDKIGSALPPQALDHFAQLNQLVAVRTTGQPDYRSHADHVRILSQAVRDSHAVQVTYRGAWRTEQYTTLIHPYGLVLYEGDLYVPAYSARARAVRIFKLSRILKLQPTPHRFTRPPDFRLEDLFAGSFGIVQRGQGSPTDILCRIEGPAATIVAERQWHPSQRLEPQPDGSILVRFRLDDTVEFKRWMKTLGPNAVVLEPTWLRRQLHAELTQAADKYKDA